VTPIGTPAEYFFGGGGGGSSANQPQVQLQQQQQQQQPVWHEPQYQPISELRHPLDMPRNNSIKTEIKSETMDEEYAPATAKKGRGRGAGKQAKDEIKDEEGSASHHGQEIKTKFPTARIKRIMQADEDVGKVAQVTPILVCKFPPACAPKLQLTVL
jgi:hypothetical protein